MRLQATRGPDSLHSRRADALRLGHRAAAPVRLTRRLLVERRTHDRLDLLAWNRRLATAPGAHHPEVSQPSLREPCAPGAHSYHCHPRPLSDPGVCLTVRGQQQCLRASHMLMRGATRSRQHVQRRSLSIGQLQRRRRMIHPAILPQPDSEMRDATLARRQPETARAGSTRPRRMRGPARSGSGAIGYCLQPNPAPEGAGWLRRHAPGATVRTRSPGGS